MGRRVVLESCGLPVTTLAAVGLSHDPIQQTSSGRTRTCAPCRHVSVFLVPIGLQASGANFFAVEECTSSAWHQHHRSHHRVQRHENAHHSRATVRTERTRSLAVGPPLLSAHLLFEKREVW